MGNQLSEVRKIAHKARKWTEKIAKKYPYEFGEDLDCLCGVASAKLASMLKKAGIKVQICQGGYHVFVLWNDYVIDITATQFSCENKKVMIVPLSIVENKYAPFDWYKVKEIFTSVSAFMKYQSKDLYWPVYQRYAKYKNLFRDM